MAEAPAQGSPIQGRVDALDTIDRALLQALMEDGRLSNKELAARVHLAPSSCLSRVRKLRESGILRGIHGEVNLRLLGRGLEAMIAVRLNRHSREILDTFKARTQALPEVLALYHIAGVHDFLVHVAVEDSDHMRDLALDAFTNQAEVSQIETHLIFEHCVNRSLPRPR